MKKMIFSAMLGCTLLSFGFQKDGSDAPKQTFYFFCLSREVPAQQNTTQLLQFVYTDISEFTGQERELTQYTRQFAEYVEQHCKSDNELCTSDLNYYPSRAEALKRYNEYINSYAKGNKYKLERIDFQFK